MTSRDADVRHGAFVGAGGLSPDCLIFVSEVSTVFPPGLVDTVSFFTLASSEQPEIPIPKPVKRTPIISILIVFRMAVLLFSKTAAAGGLTRGPVIGRH